MDRYSIILRKPAPRKPKKVPKYMPPFGEPVYTYQDNFNRPLFDMYRRNDTYQEYAMALPAETNTAHVHIFANMN